MTNQNQADPEKADPSNPPPQTTPVDGEKPGGDAANDPQNPTGDKHGDALLFWRNLNTNERITAFLAAGSLMVGLGSLAVAVMAYRTASDTRDLKSAVSGLAALAKAAQEQARATNSQLAEVKRQADNTAALFDPAKRSADFCELRGTSCS